MDQLVQNKTASPALWLRTHDKAYALIVWTDQQVLGHYI